MQRHGCNVSVACEAGLLKNGIFQKCVYYIVTHPFAVQKPAGRRAQKLRFWVCG